MYNIKLLYSGFVFGKLLSFSKNKKNFLKVFFKLYKKRVKFSFYRVKLRRVVKSCLFYLNFEISIKCLIFVNIFFYVMIDLYFYNFFL